MKLDPSQQAAVALMLEAPLAVITGGPGCHRKGQKLLRSDGTMVAVEDVRVGDRLAGYNGEARRVLALRSGFGEMARIVPVKGAPFVVNADHILTVVHTNTGKVTDVSVRDYLGWSRKAQERSKLFRQAFDFTGRGAVMPIDPYALGVLLGDGCLTQGTVTISCPDAEATDAVGAMAMAAGMRFEPVGGQRCPTYRVSGPGAKGGNVVTNRLRLLGLFGCRSEAKFVPDAYKRNGSRTVRLEMLAGLLDTDGHLNTSGGFDFVSKSATLAHDVAFIARSCGLAAYVKASEKYCQTGGGGWYWRVSITGHVDMVPTRIPRKQAKPRGQIKNALRTGFRVEPLDAPEAFYGFTLDGDGRYLLDDFTVTHNTGKTTITRTALDHLDFAGESYLLAAPTGKAARRMSEATGREAKTVHRLLGFNPQLPKPHFEHDAADPLDADVVIVDEASMLDVELGDALLAAVDPDRTRLLLVGDADQLPPVSPGQVFADLIACSTVPVARLTTLHRAAAESWVCANARHVIEGRLPDLDPRPDFRFVEVELAADIVAAVRDLVGPGGQYAEGSQVLIPQHEGAAGVAACNAALQAAINPAREGQPFVRSKRKGAKGEGARMGAGDRVIQTRNDYKLEVMNGEIGEIVDIAKAGPVVRFEGRRDLVEYSFEQGNALQLAYALTVHKTQGSEFGWAVVVCHSTHAQMFRTTGRALLYTAVTRAKQGVILVGDRKGLGLATDKHKPSPRNSDLPQRILGAA